MSKKTIYLILGFGIICISSSSILVKSLEMRGLPLLSVAAYRMIFASLLLMVPASLQHLTEIRRYVQKYRWFLLLGGFFLALHFGTWTLSIRYIPVARSVLLVTSHPIFTALASRVFLGEKLSIRNLSAVLIAFLGIIVIISESTLGGSQTQTALIGDLLALAGAITIVGYIIIGKKMRLEMGLISYSTTIFTCCSFFLLPAAMIIEGAVPPFSLLDYLFLLGLAIVPTLGGHMIFNLLLKHVSATLISIAFLGEPLGAAILAFLFWRQIPSLFTVVGGILVICGIYLVQIATTNVPASE